MSSKRRIRRKSCTGKVRHNSLSQGWAHIRNLVQTKGPQGNLRPYACGFCRFIHVGHASKAADQRRSHTTMEAHR